MNVAALDTIVGATITSISHGLYREDIGLDHLDLVTNDGFFYRFGTEEIAGENVGAYNVEHYSLTLERIDVADPLDTRTDLAGVVVKTDLIACDEWLGPVDDAIGSIGRNPRPLLNGKVGTCPPGAKFTTVVCGVVLHSQHWELLIRTHPFPQNLQFTADPVAIAQFLQQYA